MCVTSHVLIKYYNTTDPSLDSIASFTFLTTKILPHFHLAAVEKPVV